MRSFIGDTGIGLLLIWVLIWVICKITKQPMFKFNKYNGWAGLALYIIASFMPTSEDYVFTLRNNALGIGVLLLIIWLVSFLYSKIKKITFKAKTFNTMAIIGAVLLVFAAVFPAEKIHHNNLKTIPSDYVSLPFTGFEPKEKVEKELEAKGINVDFYVKNFDEDAEASGDTLHVGDCDYIKSQPGVREFDDSKYKDRDDFQSGMYAKKGSTIKIAYTDHDFKPNKQESATSSENLYKKSSSKHIKSSKKNSQKTIIKEVDSKLNTDLYQAMGWATGKLDGNGDPMPDGQLAEKRSDFDWSLYVNKMYYDNQFKKAVRIDLNKDGDDLSRADAYNYMQRAQSSATASIYEVGDKAVKFFDLDENKPDVFVTVYSSDGNLLVTSSGLNNKLKQKDFLK